MGTGLQHRMEVCGVKWSPDGRLLASGGNDNLVCIWNPANAGMESPVQKLTGHNAAIKVNCKNVIVWFLMTHHSLRHLLGVPARVTYWLLEGVLLTSVSSSGTLAMESAGSHWTPDHQ